MARCTTIAAIADNLRQSPPPATHYARPEAGYVFIFSLLEALVFGDVIWLRVIRKDNKIYCA